LGRYASLSSSPSRLPILFITELEDVVHIPSDKAPTLSLLDSALKRFIALCASYHGEWGASLSIVKC
jgi:hypothetical protein